MENQKKKKNPQNPQTSELLQLRRNKSSIYYQEGYYNLKLKIFGAFEFF